MRDRRVTDATVTAAAAEVAAGAAAQRVQRPHEHEAPVQPKGADSADRPGQHRFRDDTSGGPGQARRRARLRAMSTLSSPELRVRGVCGASTVQG